MVFLIYVIFFTMNVIKEVYEAFLDAGASKEKASKAAEALSEENLATDIVRLEKKLAVHRWMLGFNLAFTMAILWKVFS